MSWQCDFFFFEQLSKGIKLFKKEAWRATKEITPNTKKKIEKESSSKGRKFNGKYMWKQMKIEKKSVKGKKNSFTAYTWHNTMSQKHKWQCYPRSGPSKHATHREKLCKLLRDQNIRGIRKRSEEAWERVVKRHGKGWRKDMWKSDGVAKRHGKEWRRGKKKRGEEPNCAHTANKQTA